jgi:hypothetical protein
MEENGYITGVANISRLMPRLVNTVRSRYLVVREEIMVPEPRPETRSQQDN